MCIDIKKRQNEKELEDMTKFLTNAEIKTLHPFELVKEAKSVVISHKK